ncbi:MAG: ImmA/IrrE family metallo-endopeptidase [Gemmatimonadota bacterium]|nr:ImmA/IrrE family metallo-endopeptidase [Gemmatimonadota bacterium]
MPRLDLDVLVFDCICEHDGLSFNDEAELGQQGGEAILGRMLPLAGKIEIAAALKHANDPGRYRFTVGHEIGHWVLHRSLFLAEAATLDLFEGRTSEEGLLTLHRDVFPGAKGGPVRREEWQANQFAIDLLIAPDLLRAEFGERFATPSISRRQHDGRAGAVSLREHARRLAGQEFAGLPSLADTFGLSVEAMAIALEQRGYAVEDEPLL